MVLTQPNTAAFMAPNIETSRPSDVEDQRVMSMSNTCRVRVAI